MSNNPCQYSTKLVCLWLLVIMVPLAPLNAYFSAGQTSQANVSSAELVLSVGLSDSGGALGVIKPTFSSYFGLEQTASSVASDIKFTATTTGQSDFCAGLSLLLDTGTESQLGSLNNYTFGPIAGTASLQVVDVEFSLTPSVLPNIPHGATCTVTITVAGTQSGGNAGFSDSQTLTWQLSAEQVVLNEVLANPDAGQVEFIELFNMGTTSVDVAGWTISEVTGSGAVIDHVIVSTPEKSADLIAFDDSGSTVVPPGGWLALKFAGSVQYLNNDGDTITLKDASDQVLDSYTFTATKLGFTDARNPDGVGDWVDPIPTPGTKNVVDITVPTVISPISVSEEPLINEVVLPETSPATLPTPESVTESDTLEMSVDQKETTADVTHNEVFVPSDEMKLVSDDVTEESDDSVVDEPVDTEITEEKQEITETDTDTDTESEIPTSESDEPAGKQDEEFELEANSESDV